jgi:hypothetical protein
VAEEAAHPHGSQKAKKARSQVPMASSYSGGRDQEDFGLKPARGNSLRDPISKTPNTKQGWWSGLRSIHMPN